MSARARAALCAAALLALLAVGLATELARRAARGRLEIARAQPTVLAAAVRERLARLDGEVVLTYFCDRPQDTQSTQRAVRGEVERLLAALAAASGGRLRYEVCEPERDAEQAAFARLARVKPVRVRSVTRDAWSEASVWSTLSIAYGARPRAQIAPITPEVLDGLQAWITAQLDQLESDAPARVALLAPGGFDALAARLSRSVELETMDAGAALPARAPGDLVLWLEPQSLDDAAARRLLEWSASGTAVVVAGSPWRPGPLSTPDQPQFAPSGAGRAAFLRELGLAEREGVLLDELCELDRLERPQPWRVRAIANHQDFRALEGQPNGTLVFAAPGALVRDDARLDELGFDAHTLVAAGPLAWCQAPPAGPVAREALAPQRGQPAPKAALALLLAPRDPRRGPIVVLQSAESFRDGELEREDVAHLQLLDVLLSNLTSPQRLVVARLELPGPEPSRPLSPAARAAWRAACVLLPPALLLLAALLRGRSSRRAAPSRGVRRALVASAAALFAAVLAPALAERLVSAHSDLTRDALHTLDPLTRELAARVRGPLSAELWVSEALTPALAQVPARVRDLLRGLEGSLEGGLRFSLRSADASDEEQRAALATRGIVPRAAPIEGADARGVAQVTCALSLSCGGQERVLEFHGERALEHLELRLALALGRLVGDPRARGRLAVASDTPRISPAEAHLEYQTRGLFAPGGADVYAEARALLADLGFSIAILDPVRPVVPPETDLFLWLQPRRDVEALRRALAAHVAGGGRALVAAQHFHVRSRQLQGRGFRTLHWPEPQFADMETGWPADLGIALSRELVCDLESTATRLPTEIEREGTGRDFVLQESLLPFQVRVLASGTPLAGAGDQLFLWPSRIALDPALLARHGLRAEVLLSTSARAWTIDWRGGYLGEAELAPPERFAGPLPLCVRVHGRFPGLSEDSLVPAAPGAAAGELVLLGVSEAFQGPNLVRDGFRADHLMVDLVVRGALGLDFARIAARRPRAEGFEAPEPAQRLRLRAWVVASWPIALALGALAWRAWRGRRRTA
jgi:hypothetical protein